MKTHGIAIVNDGNIAHCTLIHPVTMVVRGELMAVHSNIEYININLLIKCA